MRVNRHDSMRRVDASLSIYSDMPYENLIGQVQRTCPDILIIVDHSRLLILDDTIMPPQRELICYTHSRKENSGLLRGETIYYFRDDHHTYAIWGIERAQAFCPMTGTITIIVEGYEPQTIPMPMDGLVVKSYSVRH